MRTILQSIVLRYAIIALFIFAAIFITPAALFGKIFLYPTMKLSTGLLSLFWDIVIVGEDSFMLAGQTIILVPACIAGSAYFLLLMLNLITPMPAKTRAISIVYVVGGFLALNVIRIAVFSYLFVSGSPWFDFFHLATWYIGSTIFVIGLWFSQSLILPPMGVPVYSDIKAIIDARRS